MSSKCSLMIILFIFLAVVEAPSIALRTVESLNDHRILQLPGRDLRFPGFMNAWNQQLYRNFWDYKEQFHTETVKALDFAMCALKNSFLFGGAMRWRWNFIECLSIEVKCSSCLFSCSLSSAVNISHTTIGRLMTSCKFFRNVIYCGEITSLTNKMMKFPPLRRTLRYTSLIFSLHCAVFTPARNRQQNFQLLTFIDLPTRFRMKEVLPLLDGSRIAETICIEFFFGEGALCSSTSKYLQSFHCCCYGHQDYAPNGTMLKQYVIDAHLDIQVRDAVSTVKSGSPEVSL